MKTVALFVIAASVFTRACQGPESSAPKSAPEGFGTVQKSELIVESQQSDTQAERGTVAQFPVTVSW